MICLLLQELNFCGLSNFTYVYSVKSSTRLSIQPRYLSLRITIGDPPRLLSYPNTLNTQGLTCLAVHVKSTVEPDTVGICCKLSTILLNRKTSYPSRGSYQTYI